MLQSLIYLIVNHQRILSVRLQIRRNLGRKKASQIHCYIHVQGIWKIGRKLQFCFGEVQKCKITDFGQTVYNNVILLK